MSRSRKKTPIIKDRVPGMKRLANKKIRRHSEEIPKGKGYKKLFESYDISDYYFRVPEKEFMEKEIAAVKSYLNGHETYRIWDIKDNYCTFLNINEIDLDEIFDDIKNKAWKKYYYRK